MHACTAWTPVVCVPMPSGMRTCMCRYTVGVALPSVPLSTRKCKKKINCILTNMHMSICKCLVNVHECKHTHAHCINTCKYTYLYICIYTYRCTCMSMYTSIHIFTNTHTHTYKYAHTYTCTCTGTYKCKYT